MMNDDDYYKILFTLILREIPVAEFPVRCIYALCIGYHVYIAPVIEALTCLKASLALSHEVIDDFRNGLTIADDREQICTDCTIEFESAGIEVFENTDG